MVSQVKVWPEVDEEAIPKIFIFLFYTAGELRGRWGCLKPRPEEHCRNLAPAGAVKNAADAGIPLPVAHIDAFAHGAIGHPLGRVVPGEDGTVGAGKILPDILGDIVIELQISGIAGVLGKAAQAVP